MQQVILEQPGQFTVEDAPRPARQPGHALVQVKRIGVCGTDLHAFTGKHPFIRYPLVLGHEVAVEVVEVEPNDRGLAVGDQCSLEPFLACGKCGACRVGKTNCCENMQVIGVHTDGCMQPYVSLPISHLHPSKSLTLDQLAAIEPLSIGYHAVQRGNVQRDERVLIVGAGPIGVAALLFARQAGAHVTVQELVPERRQFIEDTFSVPATADASDQRFELVIDATGSPRAMEASFERVTHGGRLVFVGVIQARISFDDALFHGREITVLASRNAVSADFPAIIQLIETGQIDPSPWVTHRLTLLDVPRQFAELPGSTGLVKAIIDVADATD